MLGAATSTLAGFQFSTIGQQPTLLNRFSNVEEANSRHPISPSPSPLSSRSRSFADSDFRLMAMLAPDEANAFPGREANNVESHGLRSVTHGLGTSPPPASQADRERHTTPLVLPQVPQHSPSPPSSFPPHVSPSLPALHSSPAIKVASAPLVPGPSNLLGLGTVPAASMSLALPQGDNAIEAFKVALDRLQNEADEFVRREDEARRHAARWHVHAEAAVLGMQHVLAGAAQRAAQLAQLEAEIVRRDDELRQARAAVEEAQTVNTALRNELKQERAEAAERRILDEAHIAQAYEKVADAARQAEDAVRKAEDANLQVERIKREADIVAASLRKKIKEDGANWVKARQEIVAQLEATKSQSAQDKQALQVELDKLKQMVEQERKRSSQLIEENRTLEECLASERAAANVRSSPESTHLQTDMLPPSAYPAIPIPRSGRQTTFAMIPASEQDAASCKRSRGVKLQISTVPSDITSVPRRTTSTSAVKSENFVSPVRQAQRSLGAEEDEEDDVKAEYKPDTVRPLQDSSTPTGQSREPRREQSLDYATPQPTPTIASNALVSAIATSPNTLPSESQSAKQRADSPVLQLRYPTSPEPTPVRVSWQDTIAARSPQQDFMDTSAQMADDTLPQLNTHSDQLDPSTQPSNNRGANSIQPHSQSHTRTVGLPEPEERVRVNPQDRNPQDLGQQSRPPFPAPDKALAINEQAGIVCPLAQRYPQPSGGPVQASPSSAPSHVGAQHGRGQARNGPEDSSSHVARKRTRIQEEPFENPNARRPRLESRSNVSNERSSRERPEHVSHADRLLTIHPAHNRERRGSRTDAPNRSQGLLPASSDSVTSPPSAYESSPSVGEASRSSAPQHDVDLRAMNHSSRGRSSHPNGSRESQVQQTRSPKATNAGKPLKDRLSGTNGVSVSVAASGGRGIRVHGGNGGEHSDVNDEHEPQQSQGCHELLPPAPRHEDKQHESDKAALSLLDRLNIPAKGYVVVQG
ncbi:hypothetical protein C8Q76DRAFT_705290 [Earliella scabrosa]|nr:hypothetical protein C8Q76DRAFT_705290 [Earliella scabrosa]